MPYNIAFGGLSLDHQHPSPVILTKPSMDGGAAFETYEFGATTRMLVSLRLSRTIEVLLIFWVSYRVIANSNRKQKQLKTDAAEGEPVRVFLDSTSRDEAERIATEIAESIQTKKYQPRDFCILFRTNALSRSLEVALRNRNVPYQLVRGLEFFKRREVRDIVAWLRLLRNPRDDEAFLRIVNVPPRGIGKQSLDRLAAWAEQQHMSLLDATNHAAEVPALTRRAIGAYEKFECSFTGYSRYSNSCTAAVAPLVEATLEQTGYRDLLASEKDEEGDERLANVEELITAARQVDESFEAKMPDDDPLSQFLEQTALVADTDIWDPTGNQVALMTFHACKGLEFPVVYMIALEDGILPHERSLDDNDQLEEERRLVFVGITRGQQEVHVSASRIRDYRGNKRISAPSVFLTEMLGKESYLAGPEARHSTRCRPTNTTKMKDFQLTHSLTTFRKTRERTPKIN